MDTRILFDKDYQSLQALYLTPKFGNLVRNMKKTFSEIGCPMPEDNFSTIKGYYSWRTELYKKDVLETEYLENILSAFNLDPSNESYLVALKFKIFFNMSHAAIKHPLPTWIRIDKDKNIIHLEMDINLGISTKDDYIDKWKWIELAEKEFHTNQSRNKEKPTFERNIKLYIMFLETVNALNSKIKFANEYKSSPYTQMCYHPRYEQFEKEYGEIDPDTARAIISDYKKEFGNLNLVDKV